MPAYEELPGKKTEKSLGRRQGGLWLLQGEPSLADGAGWAVHQHMVVSSSPCDTKLSAVHHDAALPAAPPCQRGGDGSGAGSRAAGLRDAAPTFPHAHPQGAIGERGDELYIATFGEEGGILQRRAHKGKIDGLCIVRENHKVGIAHGDERSLINTAIRGRRQPRTQAAIRRGTLGGSTEGGRTHIDCDALHTVCPVIDMEFQMLHAAQRMEVDVAVRAETVVVDEFAYAPRSIAVHSGM